MPVYYLYYALPIISSLIGWFTNFLAIKMLFHPKKPVNLLFFKLQGIFPKRQLSLAESLGEVFSREFFSLDDVKSKINERDIFLAIKDIAEDRMDFLIRNKLQTEMPFLSMFISEEVIRKIKATLMNEIEEMLPTLMDQMFASMTEKVDVKEIIYENVKKLSLDKLEAILFSIMKKEFRFIEWVGAILGFMIGLLQLIFILLIERA